MASTPHAFGEPREISPHDALRDELFRSASYAAFVAERAGENPSRGMRKLAARESRMLKSAIAACRQAGLEPAEIEAIQAAGAATVPQREWMYA